jgi:phosphopantetheinyl transferase (holo-ACP synthase)
MKFFIEAVSVKQIRLLQKNPRFLRKCFTSREIRLCARRKAPAEGLASRLAIKIAANQLLAAEGFGGNHAQRMEILKDTAGAPCLRINGLRMSPALRRAVQRIQISMSHTAERGLGVAVI